MNTVSASRVGSVCKYDEVLKPFMGMMEKELHANSGKGDRPGWLSMSADTCMLEIYYHLGKLQKAVKDGNGDGICEFAADVANLSMMLTDICGALNLFAAAQPADQQGEPVWLYTDCDGYTGWTDRWDVAKHLPYHLQKVYRHAQPATAKVDEWEEFTRAFPDADQRADGSFIHSEDAHRWAAWQARAKLNGGQP